MLAPRRAQRNRSAAHLCGGSMPRGIDRAQRNRSAAHLCGGSMPRRIGRAHWVGVGVGGVHRVLHAWAFKRARAYARVGVGVGALAQPRGPVASYPPARPPALLAYFPFWPIRFIWRLGLSESSWRAAPAKRMLASSAAELLSGGCCGWQSQGCSNRESRESRGAKKRRFAPNREALNKIPNRPNRYLMTPAVQWKLKVVAQHPFCCRDGFEPGLLHNFFLDTRRLR